MKRHIWKLTAILLICLLIFVGCAKEEAGQTGTGSGTPQGESKEDYFEWEDNLIIGLTEEGAAQKELVIPERCEGFSDVVFSDCSVEKVSFESDKDIELDWAFVGTHATTVILPKELTVIPSTAFRHSENLETVVLPESLKELGTYAFSTCKKLVHVEFSGNQLREISASCFQYCSALETIAIPEGVEKIAEDAFLNCTSLNSVTFPESLKGIDANAFSNTSLTELHFPEKVTDLSVNGFAFGADVYQMKVYISAGSWLDTNRDKWVIDFGEVIAE